MLRRSGLGQPENQFGQPENQFGQPSPEEVARRLRESRLGRKFAQRDAKIQRIGNALEQASTLRENRMNRLSGRLEDQAAQRDARMPSLFGSPLRRA